MKRLSKKQLQRIADAKASVTDAADALKTVLDAVRDEGTAKLEALREAVDEFKSWREDVIDSEIDEPFTAYEDAVTEARDLMDEIAGEAESYFGDQSDKWQESEKGEAYEQWVNSLRDLHDSIDEASRFEIEELDVDLPKEIIEFNSAPEDIPGGDDLFDNLVEEPEL